MRNQTPWQPLALLALALFGALVLRHLSLPAGAAVAGFGFTGIVLHYRNLRVPAVRRCVPAVEAGRRGMHATEGKRLTSHVARE